MDGRRRGFFRRWIPQFSLRTLLLVMLVACVAIGLAGNSIRRQLRAVAAIRTAGGVVGFDYEPGWLSPLIYCEGIECARDVWFNESPATDQQVAFVADLDSIEYLDASYTRISDEAIAAIGRCRNLKYLDLRETHMTDAGMRHLRNLRQLEHLCLDGTDIGDRGLAHVAEMEHLQDITLSRTSVSDAGLKHLRGLKSLESFDVDQTLVCATSDDLAEMFFPALKSFTSNDTCPPAQLR